MMIDKIIIFTDLDATMLDENYSYKAASSALKMIKDTGIHLVLNSSKTLSEMISLRNELDFLDPIIAENGTVTGIPKNLINQEYKNDELYIDVEGFISRSKIKKIIYSIREKYNFEFEGFSDWDVDTVSKKTNLSYNDAVNSMDRIMTEPIIWLDNVENYKTFIDMLKSAEIQCVSGGKFKHIMSAKANKGEAMNKVLKYYKKYYEKTNIVSIALGDSENDIPMLNASDYPIVILNPSKKTISVDHTNVKFSKIAGPSGWNNEIIEVLNYLNKNKMVGIK